MKICYSCGKEILEGFECGYCQSWNNLKIKEINLHTAIKNQEDADLFMKRLKALN